MQLADAQAFAGLHAGAWSWRPSHSNWCRVQRPMPRPRLRVRSGRPRRTMPRLWRQPRTCRPRARYLPQVRQAIPMSDATSTPAAALMRASGADSDAGIDPDVNGTGRTCASNARCCPNHCGRELRRREHSRLQPGWQPDHPGGGPRTAGLRPPRAEGHAGRGSVTQQEPWHVLAGDTLWDIAAGPVGHRRFRRRRRPCTGPAGTKPTGPSSARTRMSCSRAKSCSHPHRPKHP